MSENKEALPRKKAVALRYDMDVDAVPKVIAKGSGIIAENIIEQGAQASVPVYQNQSLTSLLMALDIGQQIPPELYRAVAEILAYVYKLDREKQIKI